MIKTFCDICGVDIFSLGKMRDVILYLLQSLKRFLRISPIKEQVLMGQRYESYRVYDGQVSDLIFWNRALGARDVLLLYRNRESGNPCVGGTDD